MAFFFYVFKSIEKKNRTKENAEIMRTLVKYVCSRIIFLRLYLIIGVQREKFKRFLFYDVGRKAFDLAKERLLIEEMYKLNI